MPSSDTAVVRATYIWLSGKDSYTDIRSKDRTLYLSKDWDKGELNISLFPSWSFDGSSTGQAKGLDTEIMVKPVACYRYPGVSSDGILPHVAVLCECFFPNGIPTPDNTRAFARVCLESPEGKKLKPHFGLEQEYFLMRDGRPVGWPATGFPAPQGPYYCGAGADRVFAREIIDRHYELALEMGLRVSGTNAEVSPGQWEYQIGPSMGLEAGDHMIMARWLFTRILEEYSRRDNCTYTINYEPKPIRGDWNGTGMHCNFSTVDTMNPSIGYETIMQYIKNMSQHVDEDIACYGKDNDQRLTGKHEAPSMDKFTWGIGTRSTSVRIPNAVKAKGYGYLEDRRPAGNADPYLVTMRVFCSCLNFPAPGKVSAKL